MKEHSHKSVSSEQELCPRGIAVVILSETAGGGGGGGYVHVGRFLKPTEKLKKVLMRFSKFW